MAALGSQSIASSYEQLLHVDADGGGNTTTHVSVKDGDNGTTFGFTIASDALMMSSTNRLEFGDTGTYIHQSADGVLDLVSDTEIELNGTIDINGAVTMDGGNVTINDDSGDYDFRVESNGNANMLFVDGGNDHVNIGTATDFGGTLNVATADNNVQFVIGSTDADANEGPIMDFYRNSASPATNDYTGVVRFRSENDADEAINYAQIQTQMTGVADGSEEGKFWISTIKGGTERQRMSISGGETIFNEDSVDVDFRVESNGNANALFLDGATGAVTMAEQPAFLVTPASDQTNIALGSDVTILFGTEVFDQGADFTVSTGDGQGGDGSNLRATFTAPVTGKYQLNIAIRLEALDSAATYYHVQLKTSNRTYSVTAIDPNYSADLNYYWITQSVLADMDASDTAYVTLLQSGGTQQTDVSTPCSFSGYLAC
jgi:prepilin-type processing-associated H-X9-DG protein